MRAADAEAEHEYWYARGVVLDEKDEPVHAALLAIAAELRAQRIARRPGGGQT